MAPQLGYAVDYSDQYMALFCLSAITGREDQAVKGTDSGPYYKDVSGRDLFYEDLIAWHKWYEDNKCTMDMAEADSLMKILTIKRDGDTVSWPPFYSEISGKYSNVGP